jgi:dTDP-4-dehydrorhamnose reductase
MNILVTGANGQLGNEMRILAKDSEDEYIFTDVVDASEESIAILNGVLRLVESPRKAGKNLSSFLKESLSRKAGWP